LEVLRGDAAQNFQFPDPPHLRVELPKGLITVIIIQFRNILLQLCFNRHPQTTDAILTLPVVQLTLTI
jgi:hypothetical protein